MPLSLDRLPSMVKEEGILCNPTQGHGHSALTTSASRECGHVFLRLSCIFMETGVRDEVRIPEKSFISLFFSTQENISYQPRE